MRTPAAKLSDEKFEALKTTLNQTIHELVFVAHHLDEDNLDSAQDCLVTSQANLETVAEELAALEIHKP